jgi:hypothetical protein
VTGGRDDDRDERPRKSWREIDRARDGSGHRPEERRPRGAAAEARSQRATAEYLKQIDGIFSADQGGAEGERLAEAVREAHGTPELAPACAAYRDAVGFPGDPALLALFLDSGDRGLVVGALRALGVLGAEGLSGGLRSQLRMLADDPDDEIAEAAEDALDGA